MDGDIVMAGKMLAQQAGILGVQFHQQRTVAAAQRLLRQPGRARVPEAAALVAEGGDGGEEIRHPGHRGLRGGGLQPAEAALEFQRALRGAGAQVVNATAGMGVDIAERRVLAAEGGQQAGQQHVLDDIGKIAGMEMVAIIHGGTTLGW